MATMQQAYALAAIAVRQRYAEQYPEALEILDEIRRNDLAVFTGCHDRVQEVLSRLGLPFHLDPRKVSAPIVFANCSSNANSSLMNRIESLVSEGSWLVTSDWALDKVVARAFPNTICWNKKSTPDEVVGVEPALDSLWSDVVVLGADPQWWLEGASYPIQILDEQRVRVEAASHEMLVRYDAPVVAARFDWGVGHVFHVVSHFWLKRTRTGRSRHEGPCSDFLRVGMHLSDESIAEVLNRAKVKAEDLNFATIQSAVTSTELVAGLCVQARRAQLALQN